MEAIPTKKATPVIEESPVLTEELTTVAATNNFAEDATLETTVVETTAEEPTTETISQEEAKNNISNILSKITILNKPSEQKAVEEETSDTETVMDTANDSFVVEPQVVAEPTTSTEPTITPTEEPKKEAVWPSPAATVEPVAPAQPVEEPVTTNIQFDDEE